MKLYLSASIFSAVLLGNTGFAESLPVNISATENFNLAETPSNLSFERGVDANNLPQNWQQVNDGYSYVVDTSEKVDGRNSARISALVGHPEFGALVQCIDARQYADSEIKYSGYIKSSNISRTGYAGLWFRVDGPGGEVLAFDNMYERGVTGTTSWRRYEINLPVSVEAVKLCYGVLVVDEGTAWFDRLALEIR
jgi:hypothetical protein